MQNRFARTVTAIVLFALLMLSVVAELAGIVTPLTPSLMASAAVMITLIAGLLGWMHFGEIIDDRPPEVHEAILSTGRFGGTFGLRLSLGVTNRSRSPWWIEQAFLFDDQGRRLAFVAERLMLEPHAEKALSLPVSASVFQGTSRVDEAQGGVAFSSMQLQHYHVLDGAVCVEIDLVNDRQHVFRLTLPITRDMLDPGTVVMATYERRRGVVTFECAGYSPVRQAQPWPNQKVVEPQIVDLGDANLDKEVDNVPKNRR